MCRMSQARDIFIFRYYARLPYIDVAELTRDDIISTGIVVEQWIWTSLETAYFML